MRFPAVLGIALLALARHACAQVTVIAKPISISGARSAIGTTKVGLWAVTLTSRYAIEVDVPHERITQAFPLLRDFPNRLAEDMLTRQSSNSFWSVLSRWGPPLLTAAGAAYGAHGIAAGQNTQAWVGQGVILLPLLFARVGQRAPAPGVYFSDFCPAHIPLPAYGAASCYLAAGIVKSAAPMTALVDIPGVQ